MSAALRGITPDKIVKRGKLFLYSKWGCGKTLTALQFPQSYILDTERGAENYPTLIRRGKSSYLSTGDLEEIIGEVVTLATTPHEYRTVVIDPISVPWNNEVEKWEKRLGNEHGRHYLAAQKSMRRLNSWLLRVDMNVIVTAHEKDEYGKDHEKIGKTFDAWQKSGFLFDTIVRLSREGKKFRADVEKQRAEPGQPRLPDAISWEEGDYVTFYSSISEAFGKAVVEAKAIPQPPPDETRLARIRTYIDVLKISQEEIDKWFAKAQVETWEEMSEKQLDSVLDFLKNKLSSISGGK